MQIKIKGKMWKDVDALGDYEGNISDLISKLESLKTEYGDIRIRVKANTVENSNVSFQIETL